MATICGIFNASTASEVLFWQIKQDFGSRGISLFLVDENGNEKQRVLTITDEGVIMRTVIRKQYQDLFGLQEDSLIATLSERRGL